MDALVPISLTSYPICIGYIGQQSPAGTVRFRQDIHYSFVLDTFIAIILHRDHVFDSMQISKMSFTSNMNSTSQANIKDSVQPCK